MSGRPSTTADDYRQWAAVEAAGSSPTYERLALALAADDAAIALVDRLPPEKRQPNLVFAALRWHDVPVDDADAALRWLHGHHEALFATVLQRRTQTNEVARCALLLPALAQLPEPLALVEVGASAGLCLLPDRWRYEYATPTGAHVVGDPTAAVSIRCETPAPAPLPPAVPRIAWRRGLDLHPVDPADPEEHRWLECLVWPEHGERAARLRDALAVAAGDPPPVARGDLLRDLPALLDAAPPSATPVVVHSAALAYVAPEVRAAFLELLADRDVVRLGAEGARVLPHLEPALPATRGRGDFVVSRDDEVLALADPHGRWLRWIAG